MDLLAYLGYFVLAWIVAGAVGVGAEKATKNDTAGGVACLAALFVMGLIAFAIFK